MKDHIEAAEGRMKEHTETVETRLLTEFWKWARTCDMKVRQQGSNINTMDERMTLLEERRCSSSNCAGASDGAPPEHIKSTCREVRTERCGRRSSFVV